MLSMKKAPIFVITVLALVSIAATASDEYLKFKREGTSSGGGSGGNVHDKFIAAGKRVLYYLATDDEGKALVKSKSLNLCRLNQTLDENLVFVSKNLVDRRGSKADAHGQHWQIVLDESEWKDLIEKKSDYYYLVFKEMLRSEGTYDDDNEAIKIARNLLPFPEKLRLDRALSEEQNMNYGDYSCLNNDDIERIAELRKEGQLFHAGELKMCVPEQTTDSILMLADQMLSLARYTQCKYEPTECGTPDATAIVGGNRVRFRTITWQGKFIYHKPYISTSLVDGSNTPLSPDIVFADIENKLSELERYNICLPRLRPTTQKPLGSNEGVVRDPDGADALLPFSYLIKADLDTPRSYCDQECLNKYYVGIVGHESRIEILNRKIYFDRLRGAYVKVRILSNTIDKVDSSGNIFFSNGTPRFTVQRSPPKAAIGAEGYMGLRMTTFNNNYDGYIVMPK